MDRMLKEGMSLYTAVRGSGLAARNRDALMKDYQHLTQFAESKKR